MIKTLDKITLNPATATGDVAVGGDLLTASGTGTVESRFLVADGLWGWDSVYIAADLPAGASISAQYAVSKDCRRWSAWMAITDLPALPYIKVRLTLVDAAMTAMRIFWRDRPASSARSFGDRMVSELPPGLMYDRHKTDSLSNGFMRAVGKVLDKHETLIAELQDQFFPTRATWGLSIWEEHLKLPINPFYDLETRRKIVLAHIRAKRGLSRPVFEAILSSLGAVATIHEYYPEVFRAGSLTGAEFYGEDAAYCWSVIISQAGAIIRQFRAGSSVAGDALYAYDDFGEVETIIRRYKPAHTFVEFISV